MDYTNYITNFVYVFPSNAIPVVVQHTDLDWERASYMWSWGWHWGAIMAGALFAVVVVAKALRPPRFPKGDE